MSRGKYLSLEEARKSGKLGTPEGQKRTLAGVRSRPRRTLGEEHGH